MMVDAKAGHWVVYSADLLAVCSAACLADQWVGEWVVWKAGSMADTKVA